jgi:hypothetical protein
MSSGSMKKKKAAALPNAVIGVVTAFAMAITAMVGAPGITYAIVAVVAAFCYTMVGVLNRRRSLWVFDICPGAWR